MKNILLSLCMFNLLIPLQHLAHSLPNDASIPKWFLDVSKLPKNKQKYWTDMLKQPVKLTESSTLSVSDSLRFLLLKVQLPFVFLTDEGTGLFEMGAGERNVREFLWEVSKKGKVMMDFDDSRSIRVLPKKISK